MKYMGQIMAECDCQTEEACMAAEKCIAEETMTKPADLTNEQLAAELLEPLPHGWAVKEAARRLAVYGRQDRWKAKEIESYMNKGAAW